MQRHNQVLLFLCTCCFCLFMMLLLPPAYQPTMSAISNLPALPKLPDNMWIPQLPPQLFSGPLPRVLCWVNTHPPNHAKKAAHIKATWGR